MLADEAGPSMMHLQSYLGGYKGEGGKATFPLGQLRGSTIRGKWYPWRSTSHRQNQKLRLGKATKREPGSRDKLAVFSRFATVGSIPLLNDGGVPKNSQSPPPPPQGWGRWPLRNGMVGSAWVAHEGKEAAARMIKRRRTGHHQGSSS